MFEAKRHSLRTRLVLAFILTVLLPISGLSLILVVSANRTAEEEINRQLSTIASFKASAIEEWTATLKAVLGNALVGETTLADASRVLGQSEIDPSETRAVQQARSRLRTRLLGLLAASPHFYEYFILDTGGRVVLATSPGREGQVYSDQNFFQQGKIRTFVDSPFYSQAERAVYLFVAYPVYAESSTDQQEGQQGNLRPPELVGILVGRAKLDTLQNALQDATGLRYKGRSYLTSGNGSVLASSNPGDVGRQVIGLLPIVTNLAGQIQSGRPAIASYNNLDESPVDSAYITLTEPRGVLIVEQLQSEILRARLLSLAINLSVTLASMLIALYIALFATHSIAAPLAELLGITASVSQVEDLQATRVSALQSASSALETRAQAWHDELGLLASAFHRMTLHLAEQISSLEAAVAERTGQLARRANFLQASAEVSRAAASILEPEALLNQAVELIRERFDLYYVGLFIVDNQRRFAHLRAAAGTAAEILLQRRHRLPVQPTSMIGWSIVNAQPRIAQVAAEDQVRRALAELPETRSELALPLRARRVVLGALSVQSTLPNAFDADAIAALQTLADQLAIAIDNALLFEQSQQSLQAERRAYARDTQTEWRALLEAMPSLTVRGDDRGIRPLASRQTNPAGFDTQPESTQFSTPIQVRGVTIGHIRAARASAASQAAPTAGGEGDSTTVHKRSDDPSSADWSTEEMVFVNHLAEQIGIALDSARLYAETRQLADQERLVGEITARLRAALDIPTVMQTAAYELRDAFQLDEVQLRLDLPPADEEQTA